MVSPQTEHGSVWPTGRRKISMSPPPITNRVATDAYSAPGKNFHETDKEHARRRSRPAKPSRQFAGLVTILWVCLSPGQKTPLTSRLALPVAKGAINRATRSLPVTRRVA